MKKIFTYTVLAIAAALSYPLSSSAQNTTTHHFPGEARDPYTNGERNYSVLAYPNPATNAVTLQLPYTAVTSMDVLLLDYNGTVIRSYRFAPGGRSYSLDISFLNQGQYAIHMHEGGKLAGVTRLVKVN
jgi:hypothetical protein